jgi:DDE superfamily endonuclease/Helix-turn-helix of DDE superfamily endonuclease
MESYQTFYDHKREPMRYESTTGLSDELLEELQTRVEQICSSCVELSGRPTLMSIRSQVLLTLVLLRQNISQMFAADIFGISLPTVSRIYRAMVPLLNQACCMHGITLAEAVATRPIVVDGTYVPTGNRAATGRHNYSGKRHCQNLSIQVACDLDGTLIAVSDPIPGARHDGAAITLTGWQDTLDAGTWIADGAYIATGALTPKRKPIDQEHTDQATAFSHDIASLRYVVERCIAHLKNWKILAKGYRGRLTELPIAIRTITQLGLYRLGW